ncbi:hypothetical protein D3C79_947540 [compost metagenome]
MEQRNHRSRGAQHVTKADHGEAGFIHLRNLAAVAKQYRRHFATQGLQGHFGEALGTAHDVGGAHGLVSRNKHEVCNASLQRSLGGVQGANNIVQQAFCDIVLNHRNVLIGRSVIHSVDSPGFHDIKQLRLVAY